MGHSLAIRAVLESSDYETTIRKAISVGGDVDTIASMAVAVAGTLWGVPRKLYDRGLALLDDYQCELVSRIEAAFPECRRIE